MPTNDYYGGQRHGDNLFSDSLVAVDLETGERLWHYQLIHHDVWDWDIPCAPILADVTIDGVERKIVAQPTKQAWLYVFDRGFLTRMYAPFEATAGRPCSDRGSGCSSLPS